MSIIVIGDLIFDQYIYGTVNKIANEAPIPVLNKKNEKIILGGCGNVANNIATLMEYYNETNKVYLVSVSGQNYLEYLNKSNMSKRIEPVILIDNKRKTTIKTRFYENYHMLFRYDDEDIFSLEETIENEVFESVKDLIYKEGINFSISKIVFSDYNKGVLTPSLCKKIIQLCNEKDITTIADPKTDFYKFSQCTIIKPNLKEALSFYHINKDDNINLLHNKIKQELSVKCSIITLSEKGISIHHDREYYSNIKSNKIIDVTGAGDVVNAVISFFWGKTSMEKIINYANNLSIISVENPGTYTINMVDIFKTVKNNKIIDLNDIESIRQLEKNIVFTNGCFDLLHLGHIECLKYAKSLGDILIVGLNSDLSVKKLKGENRPIQDQTTRSQILSYLEFVDYVIIFEDETPLKIIETLKPEFLVKGGDYTDKKIIGSEFCKEIKLFDYISGISTTNTVNKIIFDTQL